MRARLLHVFVYALTLFSSSPISCVSRIILSCTWCAAHWEASNQHSLSHFAMHPKWAHFLVEFIISIFVAVANSQSTNAKQPPNGMRNCNEIFNWKFVPTAARERARVKHITSKRYALMNANDIIFAPRFIHCVHSKLVEHTHFSRIVCRTRKMRRKKQDHRIVHGKYYGHLMRLIKLCVTHLIWWPLILLLLSTAHCLYKFIGRSFFRIAYYYLFRQRHV